MNIREVTLDEMLDQRELRQQLIKQASINFPNCSIISYKLNIPGPIKNDDLLKYAFETGLSLLQDFELIYDFRRNVTGPEAILISTMDKNDTKLKMIQIEDEFELGRLFDLDVDGISREDINQKPRKCLICEDEAHNCSRSRKHGLNEVIEVIYEMITNYRNNLC